MSDKVVALDGGGVPSMREPLPKIVDYLEEQLERARSGDIQGIVVVAMDGDGCCDYAALGYTNAYSLLGALEYAKGALIAKGLE